MLNTKTDEDYQKRLERFFGSVLVGMKKKRFIHLSIYTVNTLNQTK